MDRFQEIFLRMALGINFSCVPFGRIYVLVEESKSIKLVFFCLVFIWHHERIITVIQSSSSSNPANYLGFSHQ